MQEHRRYETSPWITLDLDTWAPLTAGRAPGLCRKKAVLYHQSDPSDCVFIVKSGRLRVTSYQADGAEKQLFVAEKGAMVGESSCLNAKAHNTSAVAIVDSMVWCIPGTELVAGMQKNWTLNRQVISLLCRKKDILFQQMLELSFNQSLQRVAQLLLNLCHQYGRADPAGTCINVRFTHQDVASMVNASRVTVSNIFNMFTERGILQKKGGYFILTDLAAMQALAAGDLL